MFAIISSSSNASSVQRKKTVFLRIRNFTTKVILLLVQFMDCITN